MRFSLAVFFCLALACGVSFGQASGAEGAPASQGRTVSGGVLNGKATNLVKPAYPAAARAVNASGAVNVQVTIDESGNVISASAVSGHPLLRAAAVNAARQSKFSPTYLEGQAVKITGVIVYNFVGDAKPQYLTEEKMFVPFGVPLVLTAMKITDLDKDTKKTFLSLADNAPPEFAEAGDLLRRMANARTKAERNRLIDELVTSFVTELEGTNVWLAELGQAWGNAVSSSESIAKKNSSANRVKFTENVEIMNRLLDSPPADISPDFVARVKAVSGFDNQDAVETDQFLIDFLDGSLKFIESIVNSK
jgi:TonB family protein